ncbi:MAG: M13 family peptidase [Alphaproteobacteria bacterium]|nr:M13 family peptidase [Alphaproteobacteria bacterium]MBV9371382.1 M13 family peptidase [Alphaproteobacteria bacterium]MBV9901846.1 M13 family peptidase [Alphaproteobacteria bacterium]
MIKKLVLYGAATLALAAGAVPAVHAAPRPAAAKPQLGDWGVDLAGMDTSVNPGDSFFDYVNGRWAKSTEIPADKSVWGGFSVLDELSTQRTREIIEEAARAGGPAGSNQRKVGDFYASFMDEAGIEAKGNAPLKPWLARISALSSKSDLARTFGELGQYGIGSPVGAQVEQDLRDNSRYAVYLGQGGLGLPDRDYYSAANFADARAKYKAHVATMLTLAGIADAEAKAQRIFDLETKIAASHWTRTERRQLDKLYNPMTASQLAADLPGFDWPAYLQAAGIAGQDRYIVAQPSALKGAAALVQSEPLETWKDYLTYRTVAAAAPMMGKALVAEDFAFNGKVLAGTPQLRERWKRGADLVGDGLGEAIGQLYVARYFPPQAKAKADELVGNLIRAMDMHLANLAWMTPETKAKARTKLASFTPKIGYPDKWRDYSALEIRRDDLLGNAMRAGQFEYRRNLAKLGKPIDRSEWGMSPQTVNAYANPLRNEVVFPAAILQPPFFDPNADDAVNYGAIGAVIGHEISHHFDDQGRKFDPTGRMADWWTPADVAAFKALTDSLVAQYGAYEPLPGKKLNGELTLGENIADIAGLAIAYDAYHMSLKGKPAPVIGGYTGDQRFFLGYGQVWRTKYRDAILGQLLTVDVHSPGTIRPLVVRNFDAWYKAFNVRDGKLYLPPERRIRIW